MSSASIVTKADTAKNSLEVDDGEFQLVSDNATPGNDKVYGTDASGNKGWQNNPISGTSNYMDFELLSGGGGQTIASAVADAKTNNRPLLLTAIVNTNASVTIDVPLYVQDTSFYININDAAHIVTVTAPIYANQQVFRQGNTSTPGTLRISQKAATKSSIILTGAIGDSLAANAATNDEAIYTAWNSGHSQASGFYIPVGSYYISNTFGESQTYNGNAYVDGTGTSILGDGVGMCRLLQAPGMNASMFYSLKATHHENTIGRFSIFGTPDTNRTMPVTDALFYMSGYNIFITEMQVRNSAQHGIIIGHDLISGSGGTRNDINLFAVESQLCWGHGLWCRDVNKLTINTCSFEANGIHGPTGDGLVLDSPDNPGNLRIPIFNNKFRKGGIVDLYNLPTYTLFRTAVVIKVDNGAAGYIDVDTATETLHVVNPDVGAGKITDKGGGKVGIAATAHPFRSDDDVTSEFDLRFGQVAVFAGFASSNYNATFTIDKDTTVDEIVIIATFDSGGGMDTTSGAETMTLTYDDASTEKITGKLPEYHGLFVQGNSFDSEQGAIGGTIEKIWFEGNGGDDLRIEGCRSIFARNLYQSTGELRIRLDWEGGDIKCTENTVDLTDSSIKPAVFLGRGARDNTIIVNSANRLDSMILDIWRQNNIQTRGVPSRRRNELIHSTDYTGTSELESNIAFNQLGSVAPNLKSIKTTVGGPGNVAISIDGGATQIPVVAHGKVTGKEIFVEGTGSHDGNYRVNNRQWVVWRSEARNVDSVAIGAAGKIGLTVWDHEFQSGWQVKITGSNCHDGTAITLTAETSQNEVVFSGTWNPETFTERQAQIELNTSSSTDLVSIASPFVAETFNAGQIGDRGPSYDYKGFPSAKGILPDFANFMYTNESGLSVKQAITWNAHQLADDTSDPAGNLRANGQVIVNSWVPHLTNKTYYFNLLLKAPPTYDVSIVVDDGLSAQFYNFITDQWQGSSGDGGRLYTSGEFEWFQLPVVMDGTQRQCAFQVHYDHGCGQEFVLEYLSFTDNPEQGVVHKRKTLTGIADNRVLGQGINPERNARYVSSYAATNFNALPTDPGGDTTIDVNGDGIYTDFPKAAHGLKPHDWVTFAGFAEPTYNATFEVWPGTSRDLIRVKVVDVAESVAGGGKTFSPATYELMRTDAKVTMDTTTAVRTVELPQHPYDGMTIEVNAGPNAAGNTATVSSGSRNLNGAPGSDALIVNYDTMRYTWSEDLGTYLRDTDPAAP